MEELTCNQLMVGDWLKHANGKFYQVTRIDALSNGGIHYACGTPHLWEYNNKFEPIPLTDQILLINGFEHVNGVYTLWDDEYDDDFVEVKLKDTNYTNGAYTFVNIERGCISITELPIQYVHELQHVLKVCGIDEEIIVK